MLDLPDTPENVRAFGKRRSPERRERLAPGRGWLPSASAQPTPCARRGCGPTTSTSAQPGSGCLLAERGAWGAAACGTAGSTASTWSKPPSPAAPSLLGRLPATVKPRQVFATLAGRHQAGSVCIDRSEYEEAQRRGERTSVTVRLIRYTLDDPEPPRLQRIEHRLITSLLDPRSSPGRGADRSLPRPLGVRAGRRRVSRRHQLRTPQEPLRSEKPVGVIQEVYGLLVAHYVVRAVMAEAARDGGRCRRAG